MGSEVSGADTESALPFPLPEADSLEAWKRWMAEFGHGTALHPHGVELVSVDDTELTLAMDIGDHARQPYGLLHGGISMMLAESAASLHACWKLDLTQTVPVGIEINGSHLESKRSGRVLAQARQIRRSRTLAHHEITITDADTGRTLSVVRMTNFYRPTRPSRGTALRNLPAAPGAGPA